MLTLLSQCMMQNIHKWSKVMQISDRATSDYSTHTKLEALSLIVSAHLEDKQGYCDCEKQITKKLCSARCSFYCLFIYLFFLLFLSVTGKS